MRTLESTPMIDKSEFLVSLSHRAEGRVLIGIDEVGRGCLAGPVVTCALAFPNGVPIVLQPLLADSKALSAAKREKIAKILPDHCCYALGAASVDEIQSLNILHATLLAMRRAVFRLGIPGYAVVDGNQMPKLPIDGETIIKGDSLIPEIMAASIMAKVARDFLMMKLGLRYNNYGFGVHAGYPTPFHRTALISHGACPHHRQKFISKILAKAEKLIS
jgi:ribonuclease HII